MLPRNVDECAISLVLARCERGHAASDVAAGVKDTEGKWLSEKDVNANTSNATSLKPSSDYPWCLEEDHFQAMMLHRDACELADGIDVEAALADLNVTHADHISIDDQTEFVHPFSTIFTDSISLLYSMDAWWAYAKVFREEHRDARTALRLANQAQRALDQLGGQHDEDHKIIRETVLSALCDVLALDRIACNFGIAPDDVAREPLLSRLCGNRD